MGVKFFKAETRNDTDLNGGYEDQTAEIVSGVYNNLFPDATPGELQNGKTRYRKMFVHFIGETASTLLFGIYNRSTGDDYFRVCAGTAGQTQGALLASSPKWHGTGVLYADAAAGSTHLSVVFDGTPPDLEVDDRVLITSKPDPYGSGNEEIRRIASFSYAGSCVEIYLTEQLTHSYSVGDRVAHLVDLGSCQTSWSDWTENSSSGTYDEDTYPPELYDWGTIEESWTVTFTGATTFTCEGDRVGDVGSGNISEDFSPQNPAGGTYFTLKADGWGGTWDTGDTITFKTHPNSKAVWMKEVIPTNCAAIPSNEWSIFVYWS